MKRIKLTQGKYTIVDNRDFKWLNQWKWHLRDTGKNLYAIRRDYSSKPPKWVRMHRLIINAPDNFQVDHKNRNSLDNRRSNLRLCNNRQNHWNLLRKKKAISELKGVHWHKQNKIWRARINFYGKEINLGCYKDKYKAAIIYNKAATKYFGEFALLNKI